MCSGRTLTRRPPLTIFTTLFTSPDARWSELRRVGSGSGDPATYRAAADLYRGDLLPEDCYEEWAGLRREELRASYLAVLTELAQLCEARGEIPQAVGALRRLAATEPAHEEGRVALMRFYAASGLRQQALAEYQQLRAALLQLDLEPDAATSALYEDILARRIPSGPPVEKAQGRNGSAFG